LGSIDGIIAEPSGGAHRDHEAAATFLGQALEKNLAEVSAQPVSELVASRYKKFRNMAQFYTLEA
jgi:acetyl-CoA carboxylase carboxyl transferase subunit alpha